jgi:hypothetical protein
MNITVEWFDTEHEIEKLVDEYNAQYASGHQAEQAGEASWILDLFEAELDTIARELAVLVRYQQNLGEAQ